MQGKRDIKAVERDLSGAIMAYRGSRANLKASLRTLDIPEATDAALVSYAEEYGIEGTLKAIRDTPQTFKFPNTLPAGALSKLRDHLTATYEAQAVADRYMAEKQTLIRESDPSHPKAVLLDGHEVIFDPERNLMIDLDTGREETITVEYVPTAEHDSTIDQEDDDEHGL